MPEVFDLAGSLALSHNIKYFYRKSNTSLWLMPFDATKLDYFISSKHAEEYLSIKHPDLLKYLRYNHIGCSMYILRSALKSFPEDSTTVQEILHKFSEKYSWNYMFSSKSILSKTLAALLALMPKITLKLLKCAYNLKRS